MYHVCGPFVEYLCCILMLYRTSNCLVFYVLILKPREIEVVK